MLKRSLMQGDVAIGQQDVYPHGWDTLAIACRE